MVGCSERVKTKAFTKWVSFLLHKVVGIVYALQIYIPNEKQSSVYSSSQNKQNSNKNFISYF